MPGVSPIGYIQGTLTYAFLDMRSTRHLIRAAALAPAVVLAAAVMAGIPAASQTTADRVIVLVRVEDAAITPVTADFLIKAIGEAEAQKAVCLVIELDTPGGLMESTRDIVKAILSSSVPVVIYVSPSGARAASAGVFITYASHVAAMAPATHIGAAHPVSIGGGGMPGQSPQEPAEDAEPAQNPMDEKVLNDAVAWVRSLAELRGRNAEWAEVAVTESESIPSSEALELNVIEILATDVDDLLRQIDSLEVEIGGELVTLETAGATVIPFEMWWGERILSIVSDPNLAFLLLMLGFYGIFFELYTPGWGIPGTVGAICLILAFFGLAVLPINYAGLLLIFLGIGLFVAEAFVTSFGILTLGGTVCLVLGGIMLVDSPIPMMRVSLAVLIPVAAGTGLVAFFLASRAISSFKLKVQTGVEAMVGEIGVADEDFEDDGGGHQGRIHVHGELWRAVSSDPVSKGDLLAVDRVDGLTLIVSRTNSTPQGG